MKRCMKLISCVAFGVTAMLVVLPAAGAQEEDVAPEVEVKQISGKVGSVDAEKSELVISVLKDEAAGQYEDIVVSVDDSAIVEKDAELIDISKLTAGEEVNVEYVAGESGKNVAIYISVQNKE